MSSTVAAVGTAKAHSVRSAAMRIATASHHERKEEEQDRSIAMPDLRLEAPADSRPAGPHTRMAIRALPTTVPAWTRGRVSPSSSSFSMSPTVSR